MATISACLVVYNEEKLLEKCLKSIAGLVDEIIIVHDGPCTDRTLEIAAKFTNKIFERPHIGIAEPHRSFTYEQAKSEWILQMDADEYFDEADIYKIKELAADAAVGAYIFPWELWDGKNTVSFIGLQKMALFRRAASSFQGVPQTEVAVKGLKKKTDIILHHRPLYNNFSWETASRKRDYWLRSHVAYFFPTKVMYNCFNTTAESWIAYCNKVQRATWYYIIFYPLKNLLGQLKNGLILSRAGWQVALQQYVYYVTLYFRVWKMKRQ